MIPNLITLMRLFLVPFTIAMIGEGDWRLAFYAFVLAGFSDAVDGFIARRFDMRTELGAYLDPLADKALLVSLFVTLGWLGQIPAWLAIVVVSRDIMIVSGILLAWLLGSPMAIRPAAISKLNTLVQILMAGTALGIRAYGLDIGSFLTYAEIGVGILTTVSALDYLNHWLKHFQESEA